MSDHSRHGTMAIGALPLQVAVVEDDPAVLELVTTFLDGENIQTKACPLGWRAHLCIRQNHPRVVILDVQLPTIDGIQLFYMLRADPTTASIPVIFLTANPGKVRQELPNYEDLGATLLCKPFKLEELLDLVQMKTAL